MIKLDEDRNSLSIGYEIIQLLKKGVLLIGGMLLRSADYKIKHLCLVKKKAYSKGGDTLCIM